MSADRSSPQVSHLPITAYQDGRGQEREDAVAVEEPLEVRARDEDGEPVTLAVTMRTPGHDAEWLRGWLHAEGIASGLMTWVFDPETPNVITLSSNDPRALLASARLAVTSSACGVCGSGSVERLAVRAGAPVWTAPALSPVLISGLPDQLRAAQAGFDATGGLHAAGLFSTSGARLAVFEDVGRHNAVDKVVGWALEQHLLPLSDHILVTSSRAGFEIVQKAALAGVPVVVTVGAPSSLAVETAAALGLTLIGFVRGDRFNVYAGAERVAG